MKELENCDYCTIEEVEIDGKMKILPAPCDTHYAEWLSLMHRITDHLPSRK